MSDRNEACDELCDPDHPIQIKFDDVVAAAVDINSCTVRTVCLPSHCQKMFEMQLHYKLEISQRTGCFKERGAANALLNMPCCRKEQGVVVASLGNEGVAMSYHGARLDIPVIVVTPTTVPISHQTKCLENGAKVIVKGVNLAEAQKYARAIAKNEGITYINGRDHPDVLNGYGTVALEILQDLPSVDAVLVPVGTGGLVASIAAVIKHKKPNCLVYGVQSENAPFFFKTFHKQNLEGPESNQQSTMADAINVTMTGSNSYSNVNSLLDKMLLVQEDWIARAILHMYEKQRLVIEGAAACPLAAILGGLVPELKTKSVVAIVTGGNPNLINFSRCIERGLSAEGRLVKFSVKIKDTIYAQAKLFKLIKGAGYNLENSFQFHRWTEGNNYKTAELCLVCRTKDFDHALRLKKTIECAYPTGVTFENDFLKVDTTCSCEDLENVFGCEKVDLCEAGGICEQGEELDTSPDGAHVLKFDEIVQAAERIKDGILLTPLCETKLSKYLEYDIYLKCENLQYTGSCAERGIRNLFVANFDEYSKRGVIVPSAGNTALAAAYHGGIMGVPVTVVMPDRTSPVLSQRCSDLGADVVLVGDSVHDSRAYAEKTFKDSEKILISSDDPLIMAGLGTLGLEIMKQQPGVDAVIVPVASGNLLAAVLVACKKMLCSCLVYGAECSKVPKMMKALEAGKPVTVTVVPNLADKLNTSIVSASAFATVKRRLDNMLLVDETSIARAVIAVLERERLVADGAGVCALAAVMQGLVPELKGRRTVCVISGGNIESCRLSRVIHRGLGANGRLFRFAVEIPDHRFGLVRLAKLLSEENAILKSMITEQLWLHSDISTTWANVVVEAANEEHSAQIKSRLREVYPSAKFAASDHEAKHKVLI